MFWTFLASLSVFALFMLILAFKQVGKRQEHECSCKKAARLMSSTASSHRDKKDDDSPFKILPNNSDGCECGER